VCVSKKLEPGTKVPGSLFPVLRPHFPRKKSGPVPRMAWLVTATLSIRLLAPFALLAAGTARAAEKVTYDDHVLPLFQQSCLNCHNPDKTKGGLDLSTFSGAMKGGSGGKIAEPGDPSSKLIALVTHSAEPKMPPEGDKLGSAQIDLLKAWIDGGLLENKNSAARKPSKPKFDTALKSAPDAKPEGPPPMPAHLLLDPPVVAARAAAVHAIASSPWAPLLAVTGQRQVLLFDTNSLELAGILPFPEGDPVSLAFTPNGRYLIVGGGIPGKSGVTTTFDVVTGERMLVAAKEFDSVLAADLTPDLSRVATGSPSRLIKVWKTDDGSQLLSIKKHTDWVTALDFSPDGILLATGDRNGGVWAWEADSGGEFHTLRAHQAAISALAFRTDSNVLASGSEDGTVRFWEMNGGAEVRKLDAHPGGVLAFAWARDGSFITSGRDRAVKLWKADFNLLREFKDLPDLPLAVAFDHEGKRAFAADYRGQISAWDVASGQPVGGFDANPPSIESRLATLRESIRTHPQTLADADAEVAAARGKLEAARSQLAEREAAARQARDRHAAATRARQEAEQGLAHAQQQVAAKKLQVDQTRGLLGGLEPELAAKRAALPALEQRIATCDQECQAAATELKRLEEELAKARAENRIEAIDALAAATDGQRQKAEAANRTLEEARSELGREQAARTALEARHQTTTAEVARLDAELAALAKAAELLPAKLEAASRESDAAGSALKEHEAAIPPARDAIDLLEKAATEATAKFDREKQRLGQLQERERHWSAAAINAQAIHARSAWTSGELAAESTVADFRALAAAVAGQSAELAKARAELAAADDAGRADLSGRIAALEAKLATTSAELTAIKQRADQALADVHTLRGRAEELRARYLALVPSR